MKQFNINLNATKKQRRTAVPDLYNEPRPEEKVEDLDTCLEENQSHVSIADEDLGYYVCTRCGKVLDNIYVNDDRDDKVKQSHMVIWSRDYDRQRWLNYGLDYMAGQNNDKLSDQAWYEVLRNVPYEFTWYDVYKAFQKTDETSGFLPWWTAFSSYIGLPIPLSVDVMEKVDEYIDYCNTKYRVTYHYLMYKFVQMLKPGFEKYIPLNRSKAWIKKTDEWWKGVCEEEDMTFHPTVVYTLCWDKPGICSRLWEHLRKTGTRKKCSELSLKDATHLECPVKFNPSCLTKTSGPTLPHSENCTDSVSSRKRKYTKRTNTGGTASKTRRNTTGSKRKKQNTATPSSSGTKTPNDFDPFLSE